MSTDPDLSVEVPLQVCTVKVPDTANDFTAARELVSNAVDQFVACTNPTPDLIDLAGGEHKEDNLWAGFDCTVLEY